MKEIAANSPRRHWLSARTLRAILGIGLGLGLLFVASRNLDLAAIRTVIGRADWTVVVLAVSSVIANILAKTVRWRLLLGPSGREAGFLRLLGALIIGQMLNLLLPARLGDLSRSYTVGEHSSGRLFTLGTVVLEKLLDLLAYSLLVIGVWLLLPLPAFVRRPVSLLMLLIFGLVCAGGVLWFWRPAAPAKARRLAARLPERIRATARASIREALASLAVLTSRHDRLWLGLWTAVIWATAILNNYLVMQALGIQAPLVASLLLLVVLQAGISVASVPASIGIFEYLCVLVLGIFRVEQSVGLSYGVLLHAVVMFPPALAGLPLFWYLATGRYRPTPA